MDQSNLDETGFKEKILSALREEGGAEESGSEENGGGKRGKQA